MDAAIPLPQEILGRAELLRVPRNVLASLAGVHRHTVHQLRKRGGREHRATLEALDRAVTAEEQRVLRHLLSRFGKSELYAQIVPQADPSSSEVRDGSAEQAAPQASAAA